MFELQYFSIDNNIMQLYNDEILNLLWSMIWGIAFDLILVGFHCTEFVIEDHRNVIRVCWCILKAALKQLFLA